MRKPSTTKPIVVAITGAMILIAAPATGHEAFTDALEAHYGLKSVICSACHPNSKDRTINNALGTLVKHALDGQDLTARLEAAKAEGDAATEAVEKEIAAAFIAVWPKIASQSMTIDQQFRFGLVHGSRLTNEARAELQPLLQEAAQAETFTWPSPENVTARAESAPSR